MQGFDRAAPVYDREAKLQAEIRSQLLARLGLLRVKVQRVLDLGAGSVSPATVFHHHYPRSTVFAVDFSLPMLEAITGPPSFWRHLRSRRLCRCCARAERLPFADAGIDLVFSSLMLQWSNDAGAVFSEVSRVLRPGGAFLFSTFGPDTLKELRAAWQQADQEIHVHDFMDMPRLAALLSEACLVDVVLDMEMQVRYFPHCRDLMRELKRLGTGNKARDRRPWQARRQGLQRAVEHYERLRVEQGVPASYEVLYGVAWKPHASSDRGPQPQLGEQGITLQALRDKLRRSQR